jgi:hypothetical protein
VGRDFGLISEVSELESLMYRSFNIHSQSRMVSGGRRSPLPPPPAVQGAKSSSGMAGEGVAGWRGEKGRLAAFGRCQVKRDLLRHASKEAIVMHCLPALRDQEVTDEVMDGPRSAILDQSENRLHSVKAVLEKLIVR